MEPNDHVIDQFSALFDHQLSNETKGEVEGHIASCASCRAEWDAFAKSIRATRLLPLAEAPPDFSAGVVARIRQRSHGRFFGQRRWTDRMPYELVSVIMLAAIVAIYIWLQISQPGLNAH